MHVPQPIVQELRERFNSVPFVEQEAQDGTPTLWVRPEDVRDVLSYLKKEAKPPFSFLFDLSAVDERVRRAAPAGQPLCEFSLLYQLLSVDRNQDIRLKVPLQGEYPTHRSITDLWPSANWYEREVWDMFGIRFEGHPFPRRILMPEYWKGHPLRKEHPARRTDMEPYQLAATPEQEVVERYEFRPEDYGFARSEDGLDYMYLNMGPHHPGTHGIVRFVLQLEGERIQDVGIQIGFHHRA
jgi:NADH-quinone oxidoreductase subunit C/D